MTAAQASELLTKAVKLDVDLVRPLAIHPVNLVSRMGGSTLYAGGRRPTI